MSFSIILPRPHTQATVIWRRMSSDSLKVKSHRTLPDAKMRALISLYHQAETFITPENLSQRIDDAFIPQPRMDSRLGRNTFSMKDLSSALIEQRRAPKAIEWDDEALRKRDLYMNTSWSSIKTARELKVVEALYGVNATEVGEVYPGLEILEEAVEAQSIPDAMSEENMKEYRGIT